VAEIQNFAHLSQDLWYAGYVVECDQCERLLNWGAEGSLTSAAPGRPVTGPPVGSRFSQSRVLCNCCLADRLYGDIGVWLIVALAASSGGDAGQAGVAQGPVTTALDALLRLNTAAGADQLVGLLGEEAKAPEVRAVVLQKARARVASMLGGAKSEPQSSKPKAESQSSGKEPPHRRGNRGIEPCTQGAPRSGGRRVCTPPAPE